VITDTCVISNGVRNTRTAHETAVCRNLHTIRLIQIPALVLNRAFYCCVRWHRPDMYWVCVCVCACLCVCVCGYRLFVTSNQCMVRSHLKVNDQTVCMQTRLAVNGALKRFCEEMRPVAMRNWPLWLDEQQEETINKGKYLLCLRVTAVWDIQNGTGGRADCHCCTVQWFGVQRAACSVLRLYIPAIYEGCNFKSGNYLFTTDTK